MIGEDTRGNYGILSAALTSHEKDALEMFIVIMQVLTVNADATTDDEFQTCADKTIFQFRKHGLIPYLEHGKQLFNSTGDDKIVIGNEVLEQTSDVNKIISCLKFGSR